PRDYSRTSGLLEAIRQSYLGLADRRRLEEETRPRELRVHDAQQPIEMPLSPAPGLGIRHTTGPAAPPAGTVPPGVPGGIAPGPAAPGAAPAGGAPAGGAPAGGATPGGAAAGGAPPG